MSLVLIGIIAYSVIVGSVGIMWTLSTVQCDSMNKKGIVGSVNTEQYGQ